MVGEGAEAALFVLRRIGRCRAGRRWPALRLLRLLPQPVQLGEADLLGARPESASAASTRWKRAVNLAFAARSAASGSTPRCRPRLTQANSRSPSSSATAAGSAAAVASRSSVTSSSTLSKTGSALGQSKPTRAARFCSFSARSRAGRASATSSSTLGRRPAASALAARSAAFWASQARFCPGVDMRAAVSSLPKTWGWRRIILSAMPRATWSKSKLPSSRAIWAWKTTCSSRSPSSSRSAARSSCRIASATS